MRFQIQLYNSDSENSILPINYQYPLSSAIYKILSKGDAGYAQFLHEKGYGKGYKFFTFSDLKIKYEREGDRMKLLDPRVEFTIAFHLPEASKTFVEGLFKSEEIVIADQKSKARFGVQSIISIKNPLAIYEDGEIIKVIVKPISAIVTGSKNEQKWYDYKLPDDEEFISSLIYGWRNKIKDSYNEDVANEAILSTEVEFYKNPYRSRLIHIKEGKEGWSKIKGSMNYKIILTAERRFIDLVLNAGIGVECSQGMGCLEVVQIEGQRKRKNEILKEEIMGK